MREESVFVIDGHDIDLYTDAETAALAIEGYDAKALDFVGADGTVYVGTVNGPEWRSVTLRRTPDNRPDELVRLLRREAEYRGVSLPPGTPDDPVALWEALLVGQSEQPSRRRTERRSFWKRKE